TAARGGISASRPPRHRPTGATAPPRILAPAGNACLRANPPVAATHRATRGRRATRLDARERGRRSSAGDRSDAGGRGSRTTKRPATAGPLRRTGPLPESDDAERV